MANCEYCNKEHDKSFATGRFCNRKCSNGFSTKEKRKDINAKIGASIRNIIKKNGKSGFCKIKERIKIECLNCNKEIFTLRLNQKYCSINCAGNSSKSLETKQKISKIMMEHFKNGLLKGWQSRKIRSYPELFFERVLNDNDLLKKCTLEFPIKKRNLGINCNCNYFLDFYFDELKIDLEIDGKQHEIKDRKLSDTIRDKALNKIGIIVYRIKWKNPINDKNKEYIKNEINKFLIFYNKIKNEVTSAIQSE